jgi:phthiocerol/phenolphthiocerol synthesis type-I polyketide synthase E
MREVSNRIVDLSEDRRRLLERLLNQNGTSGGGQGRGRAAPGAIPPAMAPPAPLPGKQTFEQSSTLGEVKASYKRFYDAVNNQLDASVFGPFSFFLNYGYLPNQSPQYSRIQLPDHFVNKNSVRLVLELIGDCDLKDRRILDVGCGRGGTIFVIKHFFEARSVQGLDLSPNAIASCRASHHYDNVRFDEGDAEKLPFDRELFDVVTNVESSHSYPNLGAFYTEVFRVLAPGGCFLYTDVVPKDAIAEYLALLKNTGFTMEVERDITANVLLSCAEVAGARVGAYDAGNDPELMNNFLAVPGSQVYEDMRTGRWSYRIYRFRKPAAADNADS